MSTAKPKIERPLTTKQKAFALAWVDLLAKGKENGTEAARIAGYKGNAGVLGVQAHENLRNPKIRRLIQDLRKDIDRAAASTQMHDIMCASEVLARVSALARANPLDLFNQDGAFDPADVRRRGLGYLISGIKTRTISYPNGTVAVTQEFKVENRKGFLDLLGRNHNLWTGEINEPEEVLARLLGIPKALLPAKPDDPDAIEAEIVVEASNKSEERPSTLAQNSTALPAYMALDATKAAKHRSEEQPESLLPQADERPSELMRRDENAPALHDFRNLNCEKASGRRTNRLTGYRNLNPMG